MDENSENKQIKHKKKRWRSILDISIIVFSICLLIVEGFLYYQRSYLTPFWVNGQSMYPTLNGEAYNANGVLLTANSGDAHVGYTVDYGVMNTHDSAINKIKRFDIVITKYKKNDTSNKIKRVIGLPGETLEFLHTGTGKEHNNDLYVNGVYVEQPIDNEVLINSKDYPVTKFTLKDDEYYVLGDNRLHSTDSRTEGPISKEYITGVAVAIVATCEVYMNSENELDVKNIKHFWPRFFK